MLYFSAGDAIGVITALNPFASRPNPRCIIPSHNDWSANNSFNPFGFEPIAPSLYSRPRITPRRTRDGLRIEEGLDVDNGANRGHGSTEVNTALRNTQEVRFCPLLGCCEPKANRVYCRDPDQCLHKSRPNVASIRALPGSQLPALVSTRLLDYDLRLRPGLPSSRYRALLGHDLPVLNACPVSGGTLSWQPPKPYILSRCG